MSAIRRFDWSRENISHTGITLSDFVEFETAKRQLAMKESHEKSWFHYVKELLDLYGLPSIF